VSTDAAAARDLAAALRGRIRGRVQLDTFIAAFTSYHLGGGATVMV